MTARPKRKGVVAEPILSTSIIPKETCAISQPSKEPPSQPRSGEM
jgi:hypothetical protein